VFIVALKNIICIIALILISPILILAASLIVLEDGMPIFFMQKRIGLHKNLFTIYKMRTMKKNAPQVGTHIIKNEYKLNIGYILRKLKLDEFPQLLNVIIGDLNLVGPRPGLENQYELMESRSRKNIFSTKPGITGLAQILGYDMSDPKLLAEVDYLYVKNQTVILDSVILLGTFFNFPRKYLASRFKINNLKNNQ
jgi:O-antigen biosynthesis protein WbqP